MRSVIVSSELQEGVEQKPEPSIAEVIPSDRQPGDEEFEAEMVLDCHLFAR